MGLALLLGLLFSGCALPRWPVEGRASSPYGIRRMGTLPSIHRGIDIPLATGTPVRAMSSGRVRFAGTMSGYGLVIWIDHSPSLISVYAHLSEIGVRTGEEVGGGDRIGASGASGNVTAPHLHFEIWRHGKPVDPVAFLGSFPSR